MALETDVDFNIPDEKIINYLYDKTVICPVCGKESKNKAVKKSSYRVLKRDSDSMVYYSGVNPTFYEVVFCCECGYAALPQFFENVKDTTKRLIMDNISSKWVKPAYPEVYDVNFAIKQLKLALHNAITKNSGYSEIGLICLKLSWLYRLINDTDNEKRFQEQTVNCFEQAYSNERFPTASMDEYTLRYLTGELYRRLDNNEKALQCFSNILVSIGAPSRLKEKVRDQRELIKQNNP